MTALTTKSTKDREDEFVIYDHPLRDLRGEIDLQDCTETGHSFRSLDRMMEAQAGSYRILQPQAGDISSRSSFAQDVLMGLSASPKAIPSKYFYDTEGSRLFQEIMELPEYYLTRCEFEILLEYRRRIADRLRQRRFHLIELGAGDGKKTRLLIDCFLERNLDFFYLPVDICEEAMHSLTEELRDAFPSLRMKGLICDYCEGLNWISSSSGMGTVNLVLFLGSNIGNLSRSEAKTFMQGLWNSLNHGDYVLIGFDLKKDTELLNRAYNDSRGVTAQFNLNLLRRINREMGADFDPAAFSFYGTYNVHSGAVESFLISRKRQRVHIDALNRSFGFMAWEPIQTERSHKFMESEIAALARETGFVPVDHAIDSNGYFMDSLWKKVGSAK